MGYEFYTVRLCWSQETQNCTAREKPYTLNPKPWRNPNIRRPATSGSSHNRRSGSSRLVKPESSPARMTLAIENAQNGLNIPGGGVLESIDRRCRGGEQYPPGPNAGAGAAAAAVAVAMVRGGGGSNTVSRRPDTCVVLTHTTNVGELGVGAGARLRRYGLRRWL